MKCVVSGAAGFIGSHLCEELLRQGHQVVGLDALIPYYAETVKRRNLELSLGHPNFRHFEVDLRSDSLDGFLANADAIFHLAAMPGLMKSWTDFDLYMTCNMQATERLLKAARRSAMCLKRFIFASTSSVYGRYASGDETLPTKPISPYGVTKLAAEKLCLAYAEMHYLPLVALRYFSVYGPRQRPDMGYYQFMHKLLHDEPAVVYGDGQQVRGNTYVADCVAATVAALEAPVGEIYNVGGGEAASVLEILVRIESIAGRKFVIEYRPARPGDQRETYADTSKLRLHVGWQPYTTLDEGLARQFEWQRELVAGTDQEKHNWPFRLDEGHARSRSCSQFRNALSTTE